MAKRAAGLTVRRIESERRSGMFADGHGLYLHVSALGAKSWIFRYTFRGKRHDLGIGSVSLFSLAEARDRAFAARRLIADGRDPLAERRAAKTLARLDQAKAMTFADCATAYIEAHAAGWRGTKSRRQWETSLASYVLPRLGGLPAAEIDTALVMRVIDAIWSEKPETASRVRGRIESILDWATTRGYRHGDNPARWRGHLENLLPKKTKVRAVVHHAALPYGEVAGFMVELRGQQGVAARALEFAVLTAARTGEVLSASWGEIDAAQRLWTIPAARMKAGREHRVPLSSAAMAVVEQMTAIRSSLFVFPGVRYGQPPSKTALFEVLRNMGWGHVTVHGFRSCFRDWVAERTSYPTEVAEMALAHLVGDKVEQAYRRSDQFERRRELAEVWAKYCDAAPTGQVVSLRRGT
jgi:integrase